MNQHRVTPLYAPAPAALPEFGAHEEALIERIARRVVELQREEQAPALPALLDTEDAMIALKCGRTQLYKLHDRGLLRLVKAGRLTRWDSEDVRRLQRDGWS